MTKLAIHHRKNSFSDRWISYCENEEIQYKIVNCHDNNIIDQVKDCDSLLWHHHHNNYKDVRVAKNILFSLEQAGKIVFPNFNTAWHFDDKIAQKYLLESIDAPLVASYVFYDKHEALSWAKNTTFPKVFKLKGGAGGSNVRLAKNRNQAKNLINKCFGSGFPQTNKWGKFQDSFSKWRQSKVSLKNVLKSLVRIIYPNPNSKYYHKEIGYAYFQEFIPANDSDIRVIIIGDKAFAIKRMVRKDDFRASGSGHIIFEKDEIDIRCIKIAFETSKKLNSQCLAYDFVFDANYDPKIIEISYGFTADAYNPCPGYWDVSLNWIYKTVTPCNWIIDDLLLSVNKKKMFK